MLTSLRASRDQVLAYRVAANHLAERLPAGSLLDAAGACAVQDTPPGNASLTLATRVDGLAPADVTATREEERTLVTTWSLRGAVHVFPASDLDVFTLGAMPQGDQSWRELLTGLTPTLDESGWQASRAVQTTLEAVLDLLDAQALTKAELSGALRDRLPSNLCPWCERCGVFHVGDQLLRVTALSGRFCFGHLRPGSPPRPTLVRTEQWLPDSTPEPSTDRARAELLRRFLRGYGPSTPRGFAAWTGIGFADARRSWQDIQHGLVEVEVDLEGRRTRAWLHAEDLDAFRAPPPAMGARLLAANDPFLQQRDRDLLAPDPGLRRRLWRSVGNPGLLLIGGRPHALWRARKQGRRLHLKLEPFTPLGKSELEQVEAEAIRLAPFRDCTEAVLEVAET
jgi:hypothetical protein